MLVAFLVISFLCRPVLVRLDACLGFQLPDPLACFVAIVGRVGQDVLDLPRLELGEQFTAVRSIAILTGAELHAGQMPLRIDCGVDLGNPEPQVSNASDGGGTVS